MFINFNQDTASDTWRQIYNYYLTTVKEHSKYVVFYPDVLYKPTPKSGEYNITINPLVNKLEEIVTWHIKYTIAEEDDVIE